MPIATEQEAWLLLERLNDPNFADFDVIPTIKNWSKMEFTFQIGGHNAVLTAPVMRAMLDYQDGINRAFLIISEGSANLRGLSEEERIRYEAIFKISKGSTKLDVNLQDLCKEFGKVSIEKMTGKQLVVVVLAFALLFGGQSYWKAWLDQQKDITIAENSSQNAKDVLADHKFAEEADLKKFQLMHDVVQSALGNQAIIDASDEGRRGVLKAASRVKKTSVAGINISPEVARLLARNARTPSEEDTVTKSYYVLRVDTEVDDGFRVRLKDVATGEEFFSSVRDRVLSAKDRLLIQRGEWSKKPIEARILVTRRRGVIVEARVAEVLQVVGYSEAD